MGLGRRQIGFLAASRQIGVSFERTLTLGRQKLWVDAGVIPTAFEQAGETVSPRDSQRIVEGQTYAEELFRYLGAKDVDSLDASDYEGSTVVHDLNTALPDELRAQYSAVLDVGTLEHIFNFPVALTNCLSAVRVGGHFIGITPANNWFGHGFYQFSPELYYRVLSEENGYRVRCMLVRAERRGTRWYAVADPAEVRHRITISGVWPSQLYFISERVDGRDILLAQPQQSDYAETWEEAGSSEAPSAEGEPSGELPFPIRQVWGSFPVQQTRDWLRVLSNRDPSLRPVKLTGLPDVAARQRRPKPLGPA